MNIYKFSMGIAIACMAIAILIGISNTTFTAGPFLIAFFIFMGIGFRGSILLKRYTYSLMIFAAVTTALYYPANFVEIKGFKLTGLISPLIQVIMFGMGTTMGIKDFVGVARMPKAVLIGVLSQFTIMPVIGFGLAKFSNFPTEIAAGLILIGCSPSGLASNVMNYLAKANLALSITITTITTLLAPLVTPLLMKLLAGSFVEINVLDMMWDIVKMVIFPIGAGLLFNRIFSGKARWLDAAMPVVSMIGIGVIIAIITAAGRDSLLSIGVLLIFLVLIHNTLGYTLGYWAARLFGLNEKDSRTVSLEVGMQNGGLASGIAAEMGKIATLGLAAGVFGPLMNITGSILASYWHVKTPDDPTVEKQNSNTI